MRYCLALLLFLFILSPAFAETQPKSPASALLEAAEEGNTRELRELIEKHADVNYVDPEEGITPLIAATLNGRVEAVRTLLHAKADVNLGDTSNAATPLMWAATLKLDREAREQGRTQAPPAKDKLAIAKMLIESGAKVNVQNTWGGTALQWAADEANVDGVKLLLGAHADPNLADMQGLTPLMAAAHYEKPEYLEVLKLLVAAGAKLEAQSSAGETALMSSVNNYGTAPARLLIEAGANVNAADHKGITVLMKACQTGRAEIARLLIQSGARLDAVAKDGRSVLKIARDAGYKPTIQVLLDAGARE